MKLEVQTLDSLSQTLEYAGNRIFNKGYQLPDDIMKYKLAAAICLIEEIKEKDDNK